MKHLKKFAVGLQLVALLSSTAAQAAGYVCERPAQASTFTSNGTPRGNWTVQNTGNYNYVAASGADVYQHKKFSMTIQTLCERGGPGGWNFGTRKNDHNGLQDACGTWSQAVAYSVTGISCSSGFSANAATGQCTRPASARKFNPTRAPQGNWTVQNTANFTYIPVAAPAEDFYRNTGGMRSNVVSTLCQRKGPGGWDHGERYYDYNGLNDMCGRWQEAVAASTVQASCPTGHNLVYKP